MTALDPAAALALAPAFEPDIAILDLGLPVMDGWEATRQLKDAPETRAIPIIALTAHAMADDRQRAFSVGCDDYDTKPIDFPRLLDKIQVFIASP